MLRALCFGPGPRGARAVWYSSQALSTGCCAICVPPLCKVKSWSRDSHSESEEWINLRLFSFLLRGLGTIGFPIKADAGDLFLSPCCHCKELEWLCPKV